MGRVRGASQGNKLSAYATKTERQKKTKRKKKDSAWGFFSLEPTEPSVRYNR